MPFYRIKEESAKKGMAACDAWLQATFRANPQLPEHAVDIFRTYADQGFEAAWKFRDMVEDYGFDTALAMLKAEAGGEP